MGVFRVITTFFSLTYVYLLRMLDFVCVSLFWYSMMLY